MCAPPHAHLSAPQTSQVLVGGCEEEGVGGGVRIREACLPRPPSMCGIRRHFTSPPPTPPCDLRIRPPGLSVMLHHATTHRTIRHTLRSSCKVVVAHVGKPTQLPSNTDGESITRTLNSSTMPARSAPTLLANDLAGGAVDAVKELTDILLLDLKIKLADEFTKIKLADEFTPSNKLLWVHEMHHTQVTSEE